MRRQQNASKWVSLAWSDGIARLSPPVVAINRRRRSTCKLWQKTYASVRSLFKGRSQRFGVSADGVRRALLRLGLTRKTSHHPKADAAARIEFQRQVDQWQAQRTELIYVDESGFAQDMPHTWLTQDLLPKAPASAVIIMGNARFHLRRDIRESIEKTGLQLRFLPTYRIE